MRKSWKLGAVSVALMAALGLFGCSGGDTTERKADKPAAPQAETQAPEETKTEGEAVELQIFAANSLTKAMAEAEELYTQQNPNVTFADTQYEASGTLNEMLGAGQYADILITASEGTMDDAAENGYVKEDTRQTMFNNDLVIVTKEGGDLAGQDISLEDIAAGKYSICVGDDSVPAGNYAAQSLSTVGVYTPAGDDAGKTGKEISGKGGSYGSDYKVVTDTSVGNVCKHAQSGDVDIAFVYTSDVYRFGGVEIVGTVPGDTHKNIVYPGAITKDCKNVDATKEFLDWCINSEKAQAIWQKWGFELA